MEQRKKKILLWSLGISGTLLALLVLAGIILYFSVTSRLFEKPAPFKGPVLTAEDFSPLNTAGKKISDSFMMQNGKLPAQARILFTEKEVNALLHFSSQFASIRTKDGNIRSRFHWRKGRLNIEACYIFKNRPKGKNALNISIEAIPCIKNGQVKLDLYHLKAGSMDTPGMFLDTLGRQIVYHLERHPKVLQYSSCVKTLSATADGGVLLIMDTRELMRLSGNRIPLVQ